MGAHALLSPSAAHRWLHCPAAPRLEADVVDEGSSFAEEGTLAHAVAAFKLKTFLGQPTEGEVDEITSLKEKYGTGEMDEYTDTYKAIVLEKLTAAKKLTKDAQLLVETHLSFGEYIPDAFGTGDAVIIADELMEIIDFKYGKGVKISAINNEQMMIYALGAYLKFSFEYNIRSVRMTIVQPRIDNLSEYELTVDELMKWADYELKPKAELAFSGEGGQKAGDWCRFCKVRSHCRALAEHCTKVASCGDPKLLSTEELAKDILPNLDMIKKWVDEVKDYTLEQAKLGISFPGYKLVAGRSRRVITDQEGAAKAMMDEGYTADQIYKPKDLCGITDLEKLVGKKKFSAICGEFIEKPEGAPTLVPDEDKRQAIDPAADDFKNIDLSNEK